MPSLRALVATVTIPASLVLTPTSSADEPDLPPPLAAFEAPVMLGSGWVDSPTAGLEPVVIFQTIVHVPGAQWLRLAFSPEATALAGDPASSNAARLRITSLLDGAVHHLNGETLAQWSHTSAYMNGDAVRVELLSGAGVGPSRLTVLAATAGQPPADAGVGTRSICETVDDRQLSSDPRQGRLMSVGCTAWLINDVNSTFLTAGHCTVSATSVVQFNVPLSTSGGTVVNPPPEDQYVADLVSSQGNGGGTGNDWRYFACLPNSNTGLTAYQRQQARYVLAAAAPATDTRPIRITGYGTVSTPVSPTWRQVQKTHTGPYTSLAGTLIRYHVDTTGGNSGSPVLDENANLAIGIHTHAGCNTTVASSNQGTAIQHAALQAALVAPRGLCLSGRARAMGWLYASGDQNNNLGTLNFQNGAFGRIAHTPALMQGLAFDPATEGPHGGPGVLWGVDGSNRLRMLSAVTGEPSGLPIPLTGVVGQVNGLGFDPSSGTLYGIIQANGQLVSIDRTTGQMTPIGPPPAPPGIIGAIDFDAAEGALYGIDDTGGSRLVRISTTDGTRTLVGPLGAGATDCNGLAWSPVDGALYTLNAANEQVLRINKTTGAATVLGPSNGSFGAAFGMAAAPRRLVFCRADINRDGTTGIQDLLDYLAAWFARSEAAEFDGTPGVRENDVWAFLSEWFAGCGA